jgi:hypothetical protein
MKMLDRKTVSATHVLLHLRSYLDVTGTAGQIFGASEHPLDLLDEHAD